MKAVLSNKIFIEIKDQELLESIKTSLMHVIMQKNITGSFEPIYVTLMTKIKDGIYTMPIGRQDLIPEGYEIVDKRVTVDDYIPTPNHLFKLRKDQQEVLDAVNDSTIIYGNPGFGKTFLMLFLAHKLQQRTLILVHNTILAEQWVDEVKKVLGFTPGRIISSELTGTNLPVVVANIQTFIKHKEKYAKTFGLFCVDEAHRAPSKMLRKASESSHAKYKIGLTGSTRRKDGMHVLLPDLFSRESIKPKDANTIVPHYMNFTYKGEPSYTVGTWAKDITTMYEHKEIQNFIMTIVALLMKANRCVLLLGNRVNFLKDVAERLKGELIVGATSKEDRDKASKAIADGKSNLLVGTMTILKEGYNNPRLDTLLVVEPISDNNPLLEQVNRRVLRKCAGKENALIVDIDIGRYWKKAFNSRQVFYKSQRYIYTQEIPEANYT